MYPDFVLAQLGHAKQQQFLEAARLDGLSRQTRRGQTPPQPRPAQPTGLSLGRWLAAWLGRAAGRRPANSPVR